VYILHPRDFSYCSPLFIPVIIQTTLDWHTANCSTIGNACHLLVYAVGSIFSEMCMLAVSNSIVTWWWPYISQDFSLSFVIIIYTSSMTGNRGSTTNSGSCNPIHFKLTGWHCIQCTTCWVTAPTQTTFCPLRCCPCSHWKYNPGCSFKMIGKTTCSMNGAACDGMWVNPYWGELRSTNYLMYSCCMQGATWSIDSFH